MMGLTRRQFAKTVVAAAAGAATAGAAQAAGRTAPNILVVMTDDHGQWAQGCYGDSEVLTPNMDRLAAEGTRMVNAFTTCPVCSPARASFFTGRMPSQHGIHNYLHPRFDFTHPGLTGQRLISESLKAAGYHTGLVGKWHCGRNREPKPGFDRWFTHYVDQYPHDGVQRLSDEGKQVIEHGQQSPFFTQRALEFLQRRRTEPALRERPFFLFLSYTDTHSPHDAAPADLVSLYRAATFRDIREERFAACHGYATLRSNPDAAIERRKHMDYYGAASSVDRELGRILSDLESAGELADTLIVYTGDHGLNCGQHGIWEKGGSTIPQNFLEESIRVSCTLRWPKGGVRRNATCSDDVNHCDLWATLLEVAGARPSDAALAEINSPGRSYLAQLRGESIPDWRRTIALEFGNARMFRTPRYKLILRYPFKGERYPDELYDLEADPRETVNRLGDPALQQVREELTADLDRYFATYSIPARSGLRLDELPTCAADSPWLKHPPQSAHAQASNRA